ncbi:hypothetical protein SLEP1_g59089 [Rubroshorea leprosula]|uniref:Integrase catalytic domain-containing protein n=1 Tax=Rubroshorea leprosula TaxID=152421 RepID=A0AAV5MUX1_9ROSI|nr:hypothetical protein SLEP1_g59089 [Rubroshorea leprosula]
MSMFKHTLDVHFHAFITRATPVEDVEEVHIDDRGLSRKTQIGTRLSLKERAELIAFLQANNDVFAWTSVDMPEIPTSANGKWRMCIDYTNLNQACPKDCYPMLSIDKLVEAASGNDRLSLLDAYSGYHQVPMALEDEEKTSFYAGDEIYCYVMMSFGLKNASATYQKMVTIVFRAKIGKNLEVYVDDIVVKSLKAENHLADLVETFNNLRKNRMRLNSTKCIFGVEFGKFLGFMVSQRGIEVNLEKIKKKFEWNQECQAAFDELKSYLSSPPLLTKAMDGEILYLYLDISDETISSVLVREEGKHQQPIYYINSVLHRAELRYQSEHALKFNFDATNNIAEYEALLLGLQLALELKVIAIEVYSDSQLVVNQVNSICEVVDPVMMTCIALVADLNSLSSKSVFVEVLDEPRFMKPQMMEISTNLDTYSWTNPIISFLEDGTGPKDKQEEMRLKKKASRYTLINGVLYKRSFSLPLLRCLNPYEVEYTLQKVHEGVCGSHIGARTLAHKVLRQGYYWPNMYKDDIHFVQRCPKYQFFAHLTHQLVEVLTNLVVLWPFAQWGLDLLGPFMKGVKGVTHLIVGVDYFTKWVEAWLLFSLTSKKVEDFVFGSIIYRYGIPNQIVADNESVNKAILEGIKPRLKQHKAKWADELNNVLWAYRTMSRTATGETPYHLAFGIKVVIPIEIGVISLWVTYFDEGRNGQLLQENLNLLAKVREEAQFRTLVYKQKLANFYNKQVCPQTFKVGDLVLKKAGLIGFETRFGKLAPN